MLPARDPSKPGERQRTPTSMHPGSLLISGQQRQTKPVSAAPAAVARSFERRTCKVRGRQERDMGWYVQCIQMCMYSSSRSPCCWCGACSADGKIECWLQKSIPCHNEHASRAVCRYRTQTRSWNRAVHRSSTARHSAQHAMPTTQIDQTRTCPQVVSMQPPALPRVVQ